MLLGSWIFSLFLQCSANNNGLSLYRLSLDISCPVGDKTLLFIHTQNQEKLWSNIHDFQLQSKFSMATIPQKPTDTEFAN